MQCAAPLCFRLAGPYPVLLDPTRRLEGVRRLLVCDRQEVGLPPCFVPHTRASLLTPPLRTAHDAPLLDGAAGHEKQAAQRVEPSQLRHVRFGRCADLSIGHCPCFRLFLTRLAADLDSFVSAFEAWQPGGAPIHPHPRMRAAARSTETVPNWHGIDFARCVPGSLWRKVPSGPHSSRLCPAGCAPSASRRCRLHPPGPATAAAGLQCTAASAARRCVALAGLLALLPRQLRPPPPSRLTTRAVPRTCLLLVPPASRGGGRRLMRRTVPRRSRTQSTHSPLEGPAYTLRAHVWALRGG